MVSSNIKISKKNEKQRLVEYIKNIKYWKIKMLHKWKVPDIFGHNSC